MFRPGACRGAFTKDLITSAKRSPGFGRVFRVPAGNHRHKEDRNSNLPQHPMRTTPRAIVGKEEMHMMDRTGSHTSQYKRRAGELDQPRPIRPIRPTRPNADRPAQPTHTICFVPIVTVPSAGHFYAGGGAVDGNETRVDTPTVAAPCNIASRP